MTRVLVTGAAGLVGRALCQMLSGSGYLVRAAVRTDRIVSPNIPETAVVGEVHETTDWGAALKGVDAVIHLAARTHVLHDIGANSDLYFKTNARGTRNLVMAAAAAEVRCFIYLSTVKVNGERTTELPYRPADRPEPVDAYARSKWLGELAVTEAAAPAGMEATIVRSPLVYGPGVRANFLRLMQWIDRRWLLPLGAIKNQRSLVSVWNLCDLLVSILTNPAASGKTLMVSDGEALSTPELIRRIGRAMNRRPRLLQVPVGVLRSCAALAGRAQEMERLCDSLVIDISRTREELDWSPPLPVDEALTRTAAWYFSTDR
jgi:nucleoside-diphosphate-sugar epimerase